MLKRGVILFTFRFTKTNHIKKLSSEDTAIELTERVCDLGINLDRTLSLAYDINEESKLKQLTPLCLLRRIRKNITKEDLKLLLHALVISRLDYCNSVRYGLG